MKKTLLVYPTSRKVRNRIDALRQYDGFMPSFMSIDEFQSNVMVFENLSFVDKITRVLYLQEASKFDNFKKLNFDRHLIKFFTKSDAILRFFEELSIEMVSFEDLKDADAYAEFVEHLEILETLYNRYHKILFEHGLIDKSFIPKYYKTNSSFLLNYDEIIIFIAGYLSSFDIVLFKEISKSVDLKIVIETTPYNQKLLDKLSEIGFEDIPLHSEVKLNFVTNSIEEVNSLDINSNIDIYSIEQRIEQVPLALAKIDEMVESGIEPEEIVVLLPDENSKQYFMTYDRVNNLNYAMGYDYSCTKRYKILNAIYQFWHTADEVSKKILILSEVDIDVLNSINHKDVYSADSFFKLLDSLNIPQDLSHIAEDIHSYREDFINNFFNVNLDLDMWLFLWLKKLSSYTIDNTNGGKVTVMGILESRLMEYKGVVIIDFNDDIVPIINTKDQFLNSDVRAFASLPTKQDRESLQKHYYHSVLTKAEQAVIIYFTSDDSLPSKFLYEMKLNNFHHINISSKMLYTSVNNLIDIQTPMVKNFDATTIEWSPSKLKCFLECKRKYYYKYIEKLSPKKTTDINEGAILHKVLHNVFAKQSKFDKYEELFKAISLELNSLYSKEDTLLEYYKNLWLKKLTYFIENQIKHFQLGYSVYSTEKEVYGTISGLKFKGRIDRLDNNDNKNILIDYKSGSLKDINSSTKIKTSKDFQMSIYYLLLYNQYKDLDLAFLPLFHNANLEYVTLLEERNQILLQTIEDIKVLDSFSASKCDDLKLCKYCDYTLLCERGEYI